MTEEEKGSVAGSLRDSALPRHEQPGSATPSRGGEFGHFWARGGGLCLDGWGAGPFVIAAAGKTWRFEDSDRFGPSLVKRNGDLLANPYPGERSPFWRAHRIWRRQGRRLRPDGVSCIWDEPKPDIAVRIGRRKLLIIEHGDEDGELIILQTPPEDGSQTPPASDGEASKRAARGRPNQNNQESPQ